jgi:glycosyltransferase 2 family protein
MWKRLKDSAIWLALIGAAAAIAYKMSQSQELREFRSQRVLQTLAHVRFSYILLGALLVFSSYLSRSLRWREFVLPIKAVNLGNIFTATIVGFSAIALLGRPGELVRPLLIARKEGLSASSQLAAWTVERIFDGLTIGFMMGAAILLFPPASGQSASSIRVMAHLKTAGIIFGAGSLATAAALSQFRKCAPIVTRFAKWFFPRRFRTGSRAKVERTLQSFASGLACVESVSRFLICAGLSLLVWIPVLLTYWAVAHAFGPPLSDLSFGAAVLVLVITAAGSIVQLPGVGGGSQVASALAFNQLFGIPLDIASTAAIALWLVSFMSVLIVGVPLAAREGLSWKGLRQLVKNKDSVDGGGKVAATSLES